MAARSIITDEEILHALENEEYGEDCTSGSENEDGLLVDDVESDYNNEPTDDEDRSSSEVPPQGESHEDSSTVSNVIVNLTQTNIRGKNRHVWSTHKGHTSSRTSAINIVRMARGPGHLLKILQNP